ncbi:hypothetical protein PRZ48_008843 [Zasmidium cellare]|uniref:6-phosphogluconate dehydrogenase NADP-binding domain-containing protein n=1 Tax=Zasmidium cellare TaxID=395010 RepID=A0ABR0EH12_ZASCE|nr:hypothetical protein PRZ48_008843 [Zasmidium cellare]
MAGKPVDDFIETLLDEGGVEAGDIIIDGGNSHFPDTNRRTEYLAENGIQFVGSGVSGGGIQQSLSGGHWNDSRRASRQ